MVSLSLTIYIELHELCKNFVDGYEKFFKFFY